MILIQPTQSHDLCFCLLVSDSFHGCSFGFGSHNNVVGNIVLKDSHEASEL